MTSPAEPNTFHVLSLDGGGLKGLFAAAVLSELQKDFRSSVADRFDLITGTSTGGLIALGLGAGLAPTEIVDFYVRKGPKVFGTGRTRVGRLFRPKHSAEELRAALEAVFGGKRLGESKVRLVVPAYSLDSNDVYLFKTPHHERLIRDHKESMVDVALATASAPTFLPIHRLRNNRLIDGGVWANNPVLVGVAEAVSMLDVPLERIRVLSLGATDPVVDLGRKLDPGGLVAWARSGKSILLRAPALGALHAAEHLIGPENVERVDPVVPDGVFALDKIDGPRLRGLAEDVARRESERLRPFFEHTPGPYEPLVPVVSGVNPTDPE